MDIIELRTQREGAAIERIDAAIKKGESSHQRIAVLSVKIGGAAHLRALFGSGEGEQMLKEIHQRMVGTLRLSDSVIVLSESEVLLILFGVKNMGHARLAVRKLLHLLTHHVEIDEDKFRIKPVIGIATYPDGANSGAELLKSAVLARSLAEDRGEEYIFYCTALQSEQSEQSEQSVSWNIEYEVERAIDNDEFELYYQPQVELNSGKVIGAEALLRWNHPQRGMVPPGQFIPLAEKTDAIHPLTRWTLHNALRHVGEWPKSESKSTISVNIASRNFNQPSFQEVVENGLSLWGVDPQRLVLEITEGALLHDVEYTTAVLESLRTLGIKVSVDDFGTGYSSLAYIKQLPVDELKIDQSFIHDILKSVHEQKIVEIILKIAQDFGFSVLAEGIEEPGALEILKNLKCGFGQGYLFARPMPHTEYCAWLQSHNKH
ncbi:hypothetical protein BOW53_07735 [Solemya pervernicosa gill symbiont]|uniref:GGDEF domain-containing protein n=2 Tax=Gammaproteobacteria incertae sedis TaxID=118884 RepID=A0A1T2L5U5_9GAMM|nr:GGDEF domain-containing phosphodiesterase [Candidatus Reidiella endopervernicosa]OOZ40453.1 hypothetical protein BOW53_07735 [Solemya pervernicosa gill symbiont]QKQ25368.1 GGDEF domain-containing protein [Candidatus Reidiella endopervernicosa]